MNCYMSGKILRCEKLSLQPSVLYATKCMTSFLVYNSLTYLPKFTSFATSSFTWHENNIKCY